MTPTSVYREGDTDVCREKYLLEQNATLVALIKELIDEVESEQGLGLANTYASRLEEITNV